MEKSNLEREYRLLKEKFIRHQKILIRAYESIRQKEEALEKLNHELKENEKLLKEHIEEIQAANEEISSINEELNIKNRTIEKQYEELHVKNITIEKQNEELKATMENLKKTQAELLQSEKMASLGILTAGVAHEINNPLNFIMGAYVGLKNYFTKFPPGDKEKIQLILHSLQEGIERTSKIVTGLNQFSRNVENNNEPCNLHDIIDNCLTILNHQLKNRIKIKKRYIDRPVIKGNSGKLHQVFLNILNNAHQAIEDKGEIEIVSQTKANRHIIQISDTGTGISPDIIHKITTPFYTTKAPGKGVGLGLSISYNILKEHHAKLNFISEPGKGTTVEIVFPKTD